MKHNYTKPKEIKYTKLFINGEFVDGKNKNTIDVIDPADESIICKIARAEKEDVELAIDAAHKALPLW